MRLVEIFAVLYSQKSNNMLYINDIITFSKRGFEDISIEDFKEEPSIIGDINTGYLQSKGLRYVPRTVKILYNPLAYILEKHGILNSEEKDVVGLYNISDICTLEPYFDFDEEVEQYGIQLANPMKVPYSLIGVVTGWLAIKERMHNICLSLNSGKCGVISALDLIKIDLLSEEIKKGIIVGAHYMGKMYEKYNYSSTIKTEFSFAFLISTVPFGNLSIKIIESSVRTFSANNLDKLLAEENVTFFIESNVELDIQMVANNSFRINFLSPQTSFLPIFLKNVLARNNRAL